MSEKETKYKILREHERTNGSFKPLEELEMEYVELTDKLIYIMTHGKETPIGNEMVRAIPTKVIFLDKSARPLAWLTRELWDMLAPEPGDDTIPKKPDFKFLNIDRDHWKEQLDPNKTGRFSAERLNASEVVGLRSVFGKDNDGSFDVENELDNQTIMVVDEVKSTGATLDISVEILKKAFPSSIIFGEHWMAKQHSEPGVIGNADLPVWYKDDSKDPKNEVGRGVGNRITPSEITHASQLFLSRRFSEPDQKSLRLREDFKKLRDTLGSDFSYVPYLQRDDESREKRSEAINHRPLLDVQLARRALEESARNRNRQ